MRNNIDNLSTYPAFCKSAAKKGINPWPWLIGVPTSATLGVVGTKMLQPTDSERFAAIAMDTNLSPAQRNAGVTLLLGDKMPGGGNGNNGTPAPENTDTSTGVSDFFDKHPALAWTGVGALGLGALGLGAYAMKDDDDDDDDRYYNRPMPPSPRNRY